MPAASTVRRVLLVLAATVAASLGSSAHAATLTGTYTSGFNYWKYSIAMGSGVSTLVIEAVPGDPTKFRVSESGDTLVNAIPGSGPCTPASGGGLNCAFSAFSFITVTNSGGSVAPPARDRVIARGAAHGDVAATRAPLSVQVTSASPMEFWSSDAGSTFTGSDLAVGTPEMPADIWHSGPNDLCIVTCNLGGGADRYEGSGGNTRLDAGGGPDVLGGGSGNETLTGGAGNDLILPGGGMDTLSGGDGTDLLSFDDPSRPTGLSTTFSSGVAGTVGGSPYDDSVVPLASGTGDAYDATFEGIVGTPRADALLGGPGSDELIGAGGDDSLRGAGGPDALDGGAGTDTVDYSERPANAPVTVLLAAGTGGSPSGDGGRRDTLTSVEVVRGSPGADTLIGSGADEVFDGGAGADAIDGSGGSDAASYADRASGVSVTVGGGADDGNDADGLPGTRDDLRQVEHVIGSPFADTLIGDGSDGSLTGGPGDDLLDGGGGADRLDGGDGRDTVSYATRTIGAEASLATGAGPDGDALADLEDLVGSPGDDRLAGNDEPNRLDGGAGNDTLTGAGGVDDFFGGAGDDAIFARDGLREAVECGAGRNAVDADPIDLTRDCDSDRDGDGTFDASDCAPDDASRRPGIAERPGNPVDENCDGKADPFPTVGANPILTWTLLRSGRTKIRTLRVERLQVGDQVALACKGTGCKKSATRKPTTVRRGTTISLSKHVKSLSLAPKATLEVRVSRANAITRVVTYTFKRRKDPDKQQRCIPPGQKKTQRC